MKKIQLSCGKLNEIEILRETEQSIVYLNERDVVIKERKMSNYAKWFDTKEDAINYMISNEKEKINSKEFEIKRHLENIEKFKKL